jgi:hypothetical protein
MISNTITDLVTTVDFGQTLEQMIAAGKYDWTNSDITAARFPVKGTGIKKFRNKLFHFDRDISSKAAAAAMRKEGFEPATHMHGLAFGAAFPDEQRKYPIACLGSSAQVFGSRYVVYLYRLGAGRYLRLSLWVVDWLDLWRFLGVQEVSDA